MSTIVSRVASGKLQMPSVAVMPPTKLSDHALLISVFGLALFGLVMIASASMAFADQRYGSPFYFVGRQLFLLIIGLAVGIGAYQVPIAKWERYGLPLIVISLIFLSLVLVPGIGKVVNGSRRWIDVGIFTIQVSETVKLFIIIYLANYLVRRGELVQQTFDGFIRPLILICLASGLLLAEPDFGAAVVIVATALAMLYVAGVRATQFFAMVAALILVGSGLILSSEYRMRRFSSFLEPFSDPFDSGFQLSQSLIAIGSGGFSGVGLGNSVQKLFYLPEAHTDFLFAVLCEELGFLGVLFVVGIYAFIVWRCFRLARLADEQDHRFAGYLALGVGIWIGLQSFINMGVNMGMLPTKGITLPFVSYGGSSAIVFAIAFGILLRLESDIRKRAAEPARRQPAKGSSR